GRAAFPDAIDTHRPATCRYLDGARPARRRTQAVPAHRRPGQGRSCLRGGLGRKPPPLLHLSRCIRAHPRAGGQRSGQVSTMGGTGVIDNFLGTFTQYIDSGFGLVQGDVRWLASVLIAIDIYNNLAQIIYNSFAGLGIKAGGGTLSAAQLLQPGKIAEVGIDAGKPILTAISGMMGFTSVFANLVQIVILLVAWLIVVISFFVMAIQLFVSLIEFKLTTLAGFVLVPFGLFGRTAFLAERVLGNVVSSGIKILVLAVIIGIGSTIFSQFTSGFNNPPTISDALTLILAALSLLGLTIF